METVDLNPSVARALAALRQNDRAAASIALDASQPPASSAALTRAAEQMMANRRWSDAAWLLDRIAELDAAGQIKRTLSKNLASLETRRPALYRMMVTLPADARYRIGVSKTGHPTVVVQTMGKNIALSPANDPGAALQSAVNHLKPAVDSGLSLGLAGIGDGYLLNYLAHRPPVLYMDTQQVVYLFEPDPQILLQCLMIHDYSGSNGPIEQNRIKWFVGAQWDESYHQFVSNDPFMACPSVTVGQGTATQAITERLNAIAREMAAREERNRLEIETYYSNYDPSCLTNLPGPTASRKPRALLMTTRFSTVLQYSNRDIGQALESLGWDVRILIEPTPAHRVYRHAIRQALVDFKPDVCLQIDHLRYEHEGMFPVNLPFICWIQDHLANLMCAEAGSSVGNNDFILTDAGATYTHTYGYPARQTIALTKLTRTPALRRASVPSKDSREIVFVSNASGLPARQLEAAYQIFRGDDRGRALLKECVTRIERTFADGGCLATYPDIRALMRGVQDDLRVDLDPDGFTNVGRWLTHPLTDALYRQQALRWAARAASEMGLTLSLYGNGWDKHPEFHSCARGPIAYGPALDELTVRSAINLQIVPYFSLHQRLLDGVCAGGFFLIRQHEADIAPQAMLDLIERFGSRSIRTLQEARAAVPQPLHAGFEQLVASCARALCSLGTEDPIEMIRNWHEARILIPDEGILPRFSEVSFTDYQTLRQRIEGYIDNPELRQEILARQQESIAKRLTYRAGFARVMNRMGQLLKENPNAASNSRALATGQAA